MNHDNNDEKRKKRVGKSIDYTQKAGGKIKRIVPENDTIKAQNEPKKQVKKVQKSAKKVQKGTEKAPKKLTENDNLGQNEQKRFAVKKAKSPEKKSSFRGLKVIEGGKSRNNQIRKWSITAVSAVLIIVITVFCFSTPTGVGEWLKSKMAVSVGGSGYPVSFEDSAAQKIYSQNGQLLALTDTEIRCYNSGGGQIYSRLHGFTDPVLRSSKMRALTFDRGGTQYRIDNFSYEVLTGKCDNKIIDAAIADNGYFVIAMLSSDETALVTVYDKNGNEKYKYHSAYNYVNAVGISPNGKQIAVSLINADEAVISSEINIFSIKSTDVLAHREFKDETIYSVSFSGNSTVCGISNKRWFSLNKSGKYAEKDFGSKTLVKYEFLDNNRALVCLSGASNSSKNSVLVIKPNGSMSAEFEINTTIDSVTASKDRVYVLSNELYTYSYNGEQLAHTQVSTGALGIKAVFGKTAVLYSSSVELY